MRRVADEGFALCLRLCALQFLAAVAAGQDDDVPPPPRLDAPAGRPASPQAPPVSPSLPAPSPPAQSSPVRIPNGARLAPLPEERSGQTEEIIVLGANEWRLPDLGSRWREEQDADELPGQVQATLLPLYDPENPPTRPDVFLLNREVSRIGYIELFRVRFGQRPPTD